MKKARKIWANYFESKNINFVYFSAKMSQEIIDHEDELEQMRLAQEDSEKAQASLLKLAQSLAKTKVGVEESEEESKIKNESVKVDTDSVTDSPVSSTATTKANYDILDRMELVSYLKAQAETAFSRIVGGSGTVSQGSRKKRVPTIGMVGYPNVGKSSVINVILGVSKSSHGTTGLLLGAHPVNKAFPNDCSF